MNKKKKFTLLDKNRFKYFSEKKTQRIKNLLRRYCE